MGNPLRTFIAIALDLTIQSGLDLIQQNLKKTGADVKWVKPDNIHLTLKFLGSTPVEKIDLIAQQMQSSVNSMVPFTMELSGLGAFPSIERPNILWIGVKSGQEKASEIAMFLEQKLIQLGFAEEERKFQAHITLGRLKSSLNLFALSKALKEFRFNQDLIQVVSEIRLYKSTLTSQGPIYEVLKTVDFQKA